MELGSCETCTWWRKWFDGDKYLSPLGVCLRHPPTANTNTSKHLPNGKPLHNTIYFNEGVWPSTQPEEYCGEHNQVDEYIED